MFANRLTEFTVKYELDAVVIQELVQIFNEALVEIGQGILKDSPVKSSNPSTKHPVAPTEQKWASKVAQAFAEEKELTLDDFPGVDKVTKIHILELMKTKIKHKNLPVKESPSAEKKETTVIKKKVQCNGLTAKGEPCTRTGTIQPGSSKNCYCFRHSDNWKDFETTVSSDSDSDDELEEEKTELELE